MLERREILSINLKPGDRERWVKAVNDCVKRGAIGCTLESVTRTLLNEWAHFIMTESEKRNEKDGEKR